MSWSPNTAPLTCRLGPADPMSSAGQQHSSRKDRAYKQTLNTAMHNSTGDSPQQTSNMRHIHSRPGR